MDPRTALAWCIEFGKTFSLDIRTCENVIHCIVPNARIAATPETAKAVLRAEARANAFICRMKNLAATNGIVDCATDTEETRDK